MDVVLHILQWTVGLSTAFLLPVVMRRRAVRVRASVEAALAVGAEVGPLRFIVAMAVSEGAAWRVGTLRYAERRMTWRRRGRVLDLTGVFVRSWRDLEKWELKTIRPKELRVLGMYEVLCCVHPELGVFELTAAPDDIHVVAELIGPER